MNNLKMLIYAQAKQGKTTLLGTAVGDPRLMPMLLLDFEAGVASIKSRCRLLEISDLTTASKPSLKKIDVVRIRQWDEFDVVYEFLSSGNSPYRSVCLDSLSEMNYLNLSTVVQRAKESDPKHDDIPEQRDYGQSSFQFRRLIRFFRDLPVHLFLTALDTVELDPVSRRERVAPALVGKLSREVAGLVDVVGYLAMVEEGDSIFRSLLVSPIGRYVAGQRCEGSMLGEAIDNPTLPRILDLYLGTPEKGESDADSNQVQ